jgi:hypothetical protein
MTRLESLAQNRMGRSDWDERAFDRRCLYRVRSRTPVVKDPSVPENGPVLVNCSRLSSSNSELVLYAYRHERIVDTAQSLVCIIDLNVCYV